VAQNVESDGRPRCGPGSSLDFAGVAVDIAQVRGLYPLLGTGPSRFDGPGGALQPESVVRAVVATQRAGLAAPGGAFPASRQSSRLIEHARAAISDLVGGADVVLGPDVPSLLARLADVVGLTWRIGDEIVLSKLDHDANITPWIAMTRDAGAIVRFAEVDFDDFSLPDWQYRDLITRRTKLVALTAASGVVGTRPEVAAIAHRAHEVGALVVVDASWALPHSPTTFDGLGADVIALSPAHFGGPRVGALAFRPGMLSSIERRLGTVDVHRIEPDNLPVDLLGGLVAAIDHVGELGGPGPIGRYEDELFATMVDRLRAITGATVLTATGPRIPNLLLMIGGYPGHDLATALSIYNVAVWDGHGGCSRLFQDLGVGESGGAVRVGLMPYISSRDVDRLVSAVAELVPVTD
jgi:selenocysteine lyase/cysteine desulfurase